MRTVQITLVTKGGESIPITKVNPNKRHSKNNTVLMFAVYENEVQKELLARDILPLDLSKKHYIIK